MIALKGICKTYPGTLALADVDVDFKSNEVHALVGENGAGKTTLVSILGGSITPSDGTITLDGTPITLDTPAAALRRGIAQVSQEGSLVGHLTGAENILLGVEPTTARLLVNRAMIRREAAALQRKWFPRTRVDLDIPVERLAFADQKVVEILRALRAAARLLILDEPTATLPAREKQDLWTLISGLPAQGVGIVLISHFLSEVLTLSDRITVLRDGRKVADLKRGEADERILVEYMLQRDIDAVRSGVDAARGTSPAAKAKPALAVEKWNGPQFAVPNFELRQGEIVGLIGLTGAGHFEFAASLFDQSELHGGRFQLNGCEQKPGRARHSLRRGIAMIPDHRMVNSLIGEWAIRENLSIAHTERSSLAGTGVLNMRRERDEGRRVASAMGVRCHSIEQKVNELSGGNKQKVSIGKWLFGRDKSYSVLVFVEPTEGVDVGAKSEIHTLMRLLAKQGVGIIVTSSDLLEVMSVADRVIPFVRGCATSSIGRQDFSEASFIEAISGGNARITVADKMPPQQEVAA